jgi:hypothetical protein
MRTHPSKSTRQMRTQVNTTQRKKSKQSTKKSGDDGRESKVA